MEEIKKMPSLPDKAIPASFLCVCVEMAFSSPQELTLLGCSSHYTGPYFFAFIVSEGLKADL